MTPTNRTSHDVRSSVAIGSKPDFARTAQNLVEIDLPQKSFSVCVAKHEKQAVALPNDGLQP